jgi:hypothetical protein
MFLYKVDFPFSNKVLNFKELNTKNQLDIEKINLYYPQTSEFSIDYHENFLKIVRDCVENKEDFDNLNLIEYVLFCLKLRIVSIGNNIDFNVKNNRDDVKNINIKVNLSEIMQNILNLSLNSLKEYFVDDEVRDMLITIGFPTLNSVKYFSDWMSSGKDIGQIVMESLPLFIKQVKIKNDILDLDKFSFEQKTKVYDTFPVSIKNKIEQLIIGCISKIGENNVFGIEYFKDEKINFYNLFFVNLLRVIFSQNPKGIYEEIYILSNFHVDSNYVMSISPSERKVFISFIKAQQKSKESNTDTITNDMENMKNSSAIDDLAVEFGDIPPN